MTYTITLRNGKTRTFGTAKDAALAYYRLTHYTRESEKTRYYNWVLRMEDLFDRGASTQTEWVIMNRRGKAVGTFTMNVA
jgi:hypothetical protein